MTVSKVEIKRKKALRSRLQRHASILMWKCYLQRQRRWGLLLLEAAFGIILFLIAIFIAKPVFLTPLQAEPEPPLASTDVLASLHVRNILGFAPNVDPFVTVMNRASILLGIEIMSAPTEDDLNEMLYNQSRGTPLRSPVIWVIWKPKKGNIWQLSIRSTERARYVTSAENRETSNPHLRAGFLAVQLAISQAIIEYSSSITPDFEVYLVSMPVSPLMEEPRVRKALSGILLCITLALIPPVLETEALVVTETINMFKRALRLRNVSYSAMYIGWLTYAYLTALPICVLGSIMLIMIFRWIHLFVGLLVILAYVSVMMMLALMMGMFHNKAYIACIWTTLFTLLQTYLAELLVHHQYDLKHSAVTFLLHLILPPMGLVHALNEFALLQTGRDATDSAAGSLVYMMVSWTLMIMVYFGILMLLQRTIGQQRAIGGQVSWKSIIFKRAEVLMFYKVLLCILVKFKEDQSMLHQVEIPKGNEHSKLQEVDEFVSKAISFSNVSKSIMGVPVLSHITFDIYRGEFTILFAERIQEQMINTIDDLLTGLTFADQGSINVLGEKLQHGTVVMTSPQMMGYCHRADTLVDDLTVQEHFTLFSMICLWNKTKMNIFEYGHIRSKRLLKECDLESVKHERVRNLDIYYKAQLCWALAMLLEPRVVVIPYFSDVPLYVSVIKDKIMQYRKYITIVLIYFSSIQLEYADRIFVFDSKILVFGGTPAYMFFRYGREYRLRMTLKSGGTAHDKIEELLNRAELAGAKIRAHLGSLLILRLPANPSSAVAELVKDLTDNSNKYGLTSFNMSVPDSEEVCSRAITESRTVISRVDPLTYVRTKEALKNLTEPVQWKRKTCFLNSHLGCISWKFFTFHMYNRLLFAITLISAVVAGVFLGLSLSSVLAHMDNAQKETKILSGGFQTLTVEDLKMRTTLVLRADNASASQSIASGYVMSNTGATAKEIQFMEYTALPHTESLTEYLVMRAIDSPQLYVYMYAYGMDVSTDSNGTVVVQALYSPIHHDHGAAARSMARVYMALLRHYSGSLDATIQIDDDPLALDLSPWMKDVATPPLFIQFLLILTISHITLLPSEEYGLIRHVQKHAMNFSPVRYWFTLYFCDLLLYWLLVAVMSFVMITIMFLSISMSHFQSIDLLVVPLMLLTYGVACVPQAYVFSLGPRVALNTMTFVIVNLVFGETTIIAKIFYGDALNYALEFMSLSPQFNMAYAYVKIKQIFLYNSECIVFETKNLCSSNTFHKCCRKCGVLQECFTRKNYFTRHSGVLMEVIAMFTTAFFFTVLLFMIEYRIFQRIWTAATRKLSNRGKPSAGRLAPGAAREKKDVLDKKAQLKANKRTSDKVDTFGEYLLATDLTKRSGGAFAVHNVYLGLGKGEAVALSGLKRHGRQVLCEVLAGYKVPSDGNVWCMSKWKLRSQPHQYSQQVSISCDRRPLPGWMLVKDALEMIAALRGIPRRYIKQEIQNYIEALELHDEANCYIKDILPNDRTRLHFAAAVVGAPPIIVLDECTAYQKFSVRRAMYYILYTLKKRGHAIFISSSSIESHMPVTNRLAIIRDGTLYDVDSVDNMVERYSNKGYTVVVHLKDEVDVNLMFAEYFTDFVINDTTDVLVNVQVFDADLTWASIFARMEDLQAHNRKVYSYIVTVIPIDYIYNSIISKGLGNKHAKGLLSCKWLKKVMSIKSQVQPEYTTVNKLQTFEPKYDITKLKELPWSVIFHR